MKVQSLHLSIPTPCHEDWDKMSPTEKGRHCQNCQKEVVDFTLLSDQQILDLFAKQRGSLCGRFHAYQLDRQMFLKPVGNTTPWAKAGVLAASLLLALPVLGQKETVVKTEQLEELDMSNSSLRQPTYGTVTDEMGEPLIGASILIKGTKKGTITDLDGRFQIEGVVKNDTLVVSYVGYESREIEMGNESVSTISVALEPGVLLNEVVVTGYAHRRDRTIVGLLSSVVRTDAQPKRKRIPRFASPPKREIKVYPNPFVSQIQIELGKIKDGDYQLRVISNAGQIVHQLQLFLSSYQRLEMDLAPLNLPIGTYWLHIGDGKGLDVKQQLIKAN